MILIGASGHAKVIVDILEKLDVEIDYLIDANPEIQEVQGYEVRQEKESKPKASEEVIISIGSNAIRKTLAEKHDYEFGWAIHPSAILGDDVSIGAGTVVMAGVIINSSTAVGNHNIINTSVSIDHDCQLADYVHVSPNATLCGGIKVGEGTHIGAGTTIIPNLNIGKWVTIGAGCVIIEDIPDYAVVVGNPGRIIKYNEQ